MNQADLPYFPPCKFGLRDVARVQKTLKTQNVMYFCIGLTLEDVGAQI